MKSSKVSRFLMQIIDRETGDVVQFEPGRQVETDFVSDCAVQVVSSADISIPASSEDFIKACVDAVITRGVGFGRTESHVRQDLEDGIREVILKQGFDVEIAAARAELAARVESGVHKAIFNLKKQIRP
jgi:hypothetical protein